MSNLFFISDFFYNNVKGGAEYYDKVVIDYFSINNLLRSKDVTPLLLDNIKNNYQNVKFVVSNFTFLNIESLIKLQEFKYIIIEHDYKLLKERHITNFKNNDYVVPDSHLEKDIFNFYKNAELVVFQTKFQEDVFKKSLNLNNTYNLSGSLYSDEHLNLMNKLKKDNYTNNNLAVIIDYDNHNKGTDLSVKYCEDNDIEYDVLKFQPFEDYLKCLNDYSILVFIPRIMESCSRVVIEAMCLGLQVITRNTPISKEENFINSSDKIDYLKTIKNDLFDKIGKFINA